MPGSSEKNLLRFGCPACGIRLVVDHAIAGTQGPCPSCGALIVAPPIEVSDTLVRKEAPPVAVKPRSLSRKSSNPTAAAQAGEAQAGADSVPVPEPYERPRGSAGRGRAVNPSTVLSQTHEEKKNTRALLIMVMVTSLVLCIALGVYYFMVHGQ